MPGAALRQIPSLTAGDAHAQFRYCPQLRQAKAGRSSPGNRIIKTTKAFHLLSATAWAGSALSMQALSFLLFTTGRPETVPFIRECLFFINTCVVTPGLAECAQTGLFYPLVTSIGFVKYTWITYRRIITCSTGFWEYSFEGRGGTAG